MHTEKVSYRIPVFPCKYGWLSVQSVAIFTMVWFLIQTLYSILAQCLIEFSLFYSISHSISRELLHNVCIHFFLFVCECFPFILTFFSFYLIFVLIFFCVFLRFLHFAVDFLHELILLTHSRCYVVESGIKR